MVSLFHIKVGHEGHHKPEFTNLKGHSGFYCLDGSSVEFFKASHGTLCTSRIKAEIYGRCSRLVNFMNVIQCTVMYISLPEILGLQNMARYFSLSFFCHLSFHIRSSWILAFIIATNKSDQLVHS